MPVDLNQIAQRLKQQQPVGVKKDGRIEPEDPHNDGTRETQSGNTTLQPKRFFH